MPQYSGGYKYLHKHTTFRNLFLFSQRLAGMVAEIARIPVSIKSSNLVENL